MKLTGREKILLIVLAVIVTAFAYYRLVFLPESSNIKKLMETYKSKTELYRQSTGSKEKIKALQEQISKTDSDIGRMRKGTLKPIRVPELLDELSKKAESMGVTLNDIKFGGNACAVKGSFKATGNDSENEVQKLLNSLKGSHDNTSASLPANGSQSQSTQSRVQTAAKGKTHALELAILEMSFEMKGTYSNCMKLVKYYEENERLYIVDDFKIQGSTNDVSMSITLLTYALAENGEFKYDVDTSAGRTTPLPGSTPSQTNTTAQTN